MRRTGLVLTGAVVGLVGLLGYRAVTPSLPAFVVSANAPSSSTTAPPHNSTTAAAPPPPTTSGTPPPHNSTTTTVAPPSPTTTTTSAAPSASRSATGEAVNYIYGVLSVHVTATGSTISSVMIGSIDDGGNYQSQSIDQMAIPQLEQEALSLQSANIQGISGASYTSAGFRQSLQSALTKLGL
ncbi:MAG: FMN-binding domain protein [Acidimicrobiaceae bacterium]|nr:FMN-binding domain protein [Acidimicrobiaceae bacterium]